MKLLASLVVFIALLVALGVAYYPRSPEQIRTLESSRQPATQTTANSGPVQPIPSATELDPAKVALGEKLFNDPILSSDNTVSCASCHDFKLAGSNALPHSVGINGSIKHISVPTVFNSSLNFKQFWDGRAETLEEQIDGPLRDPVEMGSTWEAAIANLSAKHDYVELFAKSYPDGITRQSISHAIAEFERSLLTPNSAFDRYLLGDKSALSTDELLGYQLFLNLGCIGCHQGTGLGGNMFQRMGAKIDYFAERKDQTIHDLGRFNVTGEEFDKYRFKVPSLRNIALTAPYFHNGSAATLPEAIAVMVRYQLGRRIKQDEQRLLVAFLNTLTGEYKGKKLELGQPEQVGAIQ